MRHPVVEFATGRRAAALVAAALFCCGRASWLQAQAGGEAASSPAAQKPAASATPGNVKPGRRSKKAAEPGEPGADAHGKPLKQLQFPLPPGEAARKIKIPETSLTGQLLSQLMAAKATRVDNEHVQLDEMHLDLYHPDGKEDFHILMPTSVFNLTTRIITSQDPVTVETQDFELTGEKMEFNTVDRTGRLIGKVRMLIHNLKQVAGQQDSNSKPE